MSTQLQRLIARARGAADASTRRIEPLLAPRYARGSGADVILREVRTEEGASVASRVAPIAMLAQSAPQRSRATTPEGRTLPSRRAETKPSPPAPQAARAAAPTSSASIDTDRDGHGAQDAPPTTVVAVADRGGEQIHEARAAAPQREAVPAPAQRVDFVREVATQTLRERIVERAQAATAESPPTVSISIGRIDVHAPPAPAPAPAAQRRQSFRPGVSLDAFLRRDGSDER